MVTRLSRSKKFFGYEFNKTHDILRCIIKRTLRATKPLLAISLLIIASDVKATYNYVPRGSIWGLGGTENQGRLDLLLPIASNPDNLFYTDVQGGYAQDDASYGGVGAGFRKLINNSAIYGGYVFIDRNESDLHNVFTVLSPGAEALFSNWDFRVNGYFPLNQRSKTIEFFPSHQAGCGDCGMNCGDTQFVVFSGHQQFEHRFAELEEAGPGADGEVGYTFHRLHNTQLHAGIYYFNYNSANSNSSAFTGVSNTKNIAGVEGRLEVPVNSNWAVTVESSYDNYQHASVVGGLRLNLFGVRPVRTYSDLHDQMVAPIIRNIGSLATGSGIPTVRKTKDEGLILERDHIYFFTSQGGSVFVDPNQSGTFENPLRNDQFSQSVVDQIGNNANLYFNTGTYLIMGTGIPPNALNLPLGDSLYGRTLDFKASAIGNSRPELLGRINLLQGNNTLDSIQLINSETSTGTTDLNLIALNIQNAPNVFLCNDNINATATVNGDLQAGISNLAAGINANNSQVTIENSTISADAIVTGTIVQTGGVTGGFNFATGIGGNSTAAATPGNFTGNDFVILNSSVNGTATAGANNWDNFATGIGSNAANGGSANFSGNTFTINNSPVSSNASTNTLGSSSVSSAIGIGSNNDRNSVTADFADNTFNMQDSLVSATASVSGVDSGVNNSVGIGAAGSLSNFIDNNFNLSNVTVSSTSTVGNTNGIGANDAVGIGTDELGNSFSGNTFNLTDSRVNSTAFVTGDNSGFENVALGIGNNSSFAFDNNTFNLAGTTISAMALVGGDNTSTTNGNEAIGIGGYADTGFTNNTFSLINSTINATRSVVGNNSFFNIALGIGSFLGVNFNNNTFNLSNTTVNVEATVGGNNAAGATNISLGIGVGPLTVGVTNNDINLDHSIINSTATVTGNNAGSNQAMGINLTTGGNTVDIDQSTINTSAIVNGTNSSTNAATGLAATGPGDVINIMNSIVNTLASASGPGTNTATGFTGNVISTNTQYNTSP